ncbi:DUF177 domain-containing protein [Acetobacteraceae bacterium KSS8]|uniref:DUF177 domain-containing protein n=1 Tax=Endosaccharibacter trunci TaxID=2812733 RepID=A0ABT1W922_9PROT|nr:DUF177 domain-containing protein [Acetobacteraceae bacterium KSS8]
MSSASSSAPEPGRSGSNRPELSRRVQINSLGRQDGTGRRASSEQDIVVEADAAECLALAKRLGVPAVHALRCRFRLGGVDGQGRVSADGLLTATLTRICVASLEEFDSELVEAFRVRFVPADAEQGDGDSLDPDADDDIPYEGTQIDLGEAAVEQAALAMEPYPRKPGVELAGVTAVDAAPASEGAGEAEERPNPFAVLARRTPS